MEGTEYPLPRIDHIYAKFSGACVFSKIDFKDAYQQLLVTNESQHLTTIDTHLVSCHTPECVMGLKVRLRNSREWWTI